MKQNIEFVKRSDIWTGKLTVKAAFTLAELLITLVVIGVVAVITIPGLVQNYKKTEYSARLKKFYSTMQQAIQMSEIDNGPLANWEFSSSSYDEDGIYSETNYPYMDNWMNKYLLPYIKYDKYVLGYNEINEDTNEPTYHFPTVYLSDGSKFFISRGGCMDIRYDVNGDKYPNKIGRDIFWYNFCWNYGNNTKAGFIPYLKYDVFSRTEALQKCQNSPVYCSVLLEYDGWEFKKDYPYKL